MVKYSICDSKHKGIIVVEINIQVSKNIIVSNKKIKQRKKKLTTLHLQVGGGGAS